MSDDEFSSPYGPIRNPTDRFAHLPEQTRKWLEQLRPDDIEELNEAVRMQRSVKAWGRITKWLMVMVLSIFLGIVAFGEGIQKFLAWFSLGARQ